MAVKDTDTPKLFKWELDNCHNIDVLRRNDTRRDPHDLAEFIGTVPLEP
ncbi:hypothetical protein ACFWN7_05685 [Agromyces sp. NPDC058484]